MNDKDKAIVESATKLLEKANCHWMLGISYENGELITANVMGLFDTANIACIILKMMDDDLGLKELIYELADSHRNGNAPKSVLLN